MDQISIKIPNTKCRSIHGGYPIPCTCGDVRKEEVTLSVVHGLGRIIHGGYPIIHVLVEMYEGRSIHYLW
jgi:hypothetical protein